MWKKTVVLLALMLVGSACSLPEELKRDAKKLSSDYTSANEHIEKQFNNYTIALTNSPIPNVSKIAEREQMGNYFAKASEMYRSADACKKQVAAIVKRDDDDDADKLKIQLAKCRGQLNKAKAKADEGLVRFREWETIFKNVPKEHAERVATAKEANDRITKELTNVKGGLKLRIAQQKKKYPNKVGDIDERLKDLFNEQTNVNRQLAIVDDHTRAAAGSKGSVQFDIAVFQKSCLSLDKSAAAVHIAMDDLDSRLDQLDESYSEILVRIERSPKYQFYYVKYEWDEYSDWDTTKVTSQQWRDVDENSWFAMSANGKQVKSGYDWELHVEDKQIVYTCYASIKSVENNVANPPKRSTIDVDTCEEYITLAAQMEKIFKGKVIKKRNKTGPKTDPDDKQPTLVDWNVELVLEQKAPGTYQEEVVESPAPAEAPQMAMVGNEEYGYWNDTPTGRQWFWHDFALAFLDHMFLPHPGMYYPYGVIVFDDWYDDYHGYRTRNGYARGYNRSGRFVGSRYKSGSYRSVATKSIRGAGPAARSRGMSGGK